MHKPSINTRVSNHHVNFSLLQDPEMLEESLMEKKKKEREREKPKKTGKKSRDKAGSINEFSREKVLVINICTKMKEEITYIIIRADMY